MASKRSTARAAQTDEELAALQESGRASVRDDIAVLGLMLIDAGRKRIDPARVLAVASERIVASLADAMTAGYLLGGLRSMTAYAEAVDGSSRKKFAGGDYADVVDFLQRRLEVSDGMVDAVRARMYSSASASFEDASGAIVEEFRQAIDSAISQGANTRQTVDLLSERLKSIGVSAENPHLIETIYRTEASLAYNAGRFETNQSPEIDSILWGYEYVTVGDDRVRPSHAALDGLRRPKDDPIWESILPPNGYNCRCTVVEIFKDETLASNRDPAPVVLEDGTVAQGGPDEGFDFNAASALAAG